MLSSAEICAYYNVDSVLRICRNGHKCSYLKRKPTWTDEQLRKREDHNKFYIHISPCLANYIHKFYVPVTLDDVRLSVSFNPHPIKACLFNLDCKHLKSHEFESKLHCCVYSHDEVKEADEKATRKLSAQQRHNICTMNIHECPYHNPSMYDKKYVKSHCQRFGHPNYEPDKYHNFIIETIVDDEAYTIVIPKT